MVDERCRRKVLEIAYRKVNWNPRSLAEGRVGFSRWERKQRRKLQRAAAESLFGDLLERTAAIPSPVRLARNHEGRPVLPVEAGRSTIKVSLSHSGSLVMAGVTDLGEIGIDVERLATKRPIDEMAGYAFGPREQCAVRTGGSRAFYRIWTLREALAKAKGVGIELITDGRDYFPDAPSSGSWRTLVDGSSWLFSTAELAGGYSASLAVALPSHDVAARVADFTFRELPCERPASTLKRDARGAATCNVVIR